MPNNYFRFKRFTVYQDKCAMKVCTDACIFGAWAAEKIQGSNISVRNILDVGCGTGLLSLMLAQNTNADIDAIEINADAAFQAKENVLQSPWKDKIKVINASIQEFTSGKNYDFIICNPPFYEADLKSPDEHKNESKHDLTLKFSELVFFIKKNLTANGLATVLIPFHRTKHFEDALKDNDLYISEKLFLKQSPAHNNFRSIFLISQKKNQMPITSQLIIHNPQRNYTTEFISLLQPYYL